MQNFFFFFCHIYIERSWYEFVENVIQKRRNDEIFLKKFWTIEENVHTQKTKKLQGINQA